MFFLYCTLRRVSSVRGNFLGILILVAGNAAAQTSSPVRIYTIPDGRIYRVDGVVAMAPTANMWLEGSRHTLMTDRGQDGGGVKTVYTFQSWGSSGGQLSTNPSVTVTADPAVREIYATFLVEHALT